MSVLNTTLLVEGQKLEYSVIQDDCLGCLSEGRGCVFCYGYKKEKEHKMGMNDEKMTKSIIKKLEKMNLDLVKKERLEEIKKVVITPPYTAIVWNDNSKTIIKAADGTNYEDWVGVAFCVAKKALAEEMKGRNVFARWCRLHAETLER